jgi:hypothetical protein
MFMTAVVDGATYVADRGFGLSAPRVPVPLVDSLVDQTTNRMQCATATSGCFTSRAWTDNLWPAARLHWK